MEIKNLNQYSWPLPRYGTEGVYLNPRFSKGFPSYFKFETSYTKSAKLHPKVSYRKSMGKMGERLIHAKTLVENGNKLFFIFLLYFLNFLNKHIYLYI